MKIAIMEKVNFNNEQIGRLKRLGEIDFYENLNENDAKEIGPQYDVVIVNWLDPTPFLMDMEKGSLVALLSTGYGWINNINEAHEVGISVANIPSYSTEAVAEHLLGLLLGVSKRIFSQLDSEKDDGKAGFELSGKTVGIIGLGNIGTRFAEIVNYFGARVITYNRHLKSKKVAEDVTLEELLSNSDIICITPSVNSDSRSLINEKNCKFIKNGAVIIGSTWDIISEQALVYLLENNSVIAAFDAAFEGNQSISPEIRTLLDKQISNKKLFLTPHSAYNTKESEIRQLNICIENIEKYVKGTPQNIVY